MKKEKNGGLSRRNFLRNTSLLAAGTFTSKLLGQMDTNDSAIVRKKKSKILNYNPKMHYRQLGKTGLMISEISLGGHWKAPWPDSKGNWGSFMSEPNPVVPDRVSKNRNEVLSYAIDAGMNFLDATGLGECMAWGSALKGRREKMIVAADDYKQCVRRDEFINVKAQIHNVEECLKYLGTDYMDFWRPQAKQGLSPNTDVDIEIIMEAFEKLKQEGKALHLGISSHNRDFIQHVIEKYPQFEMVIFPITAKTRNINETPTKDNVEEVEIKNVQGPVFNKSVFTSAMEHNVGVIAIKPFFGGSLFAKKDEAKPAEVGVGNKEDNDLARLTLQAILNLYPDAVTSVIPGVSTLYECENIALAAYTRPLKQTTADVNWLNKMTDKQWAAIPQEYRWLHDWEVI